MSELGGLQLKSGDAAVATPGPPPLPVGGTRTVASDSPVLPRRLPRDARPESPVHPDGFPPEKDIGALGKCLVWVLGLFLFGGGLIGWFVLYEYTEEHLADMLFMEGSDAGAVNPLAATSLTGADAEDMTFVSEQLGINVEMLGAPIDVENALATAPVGVRRENWPDILVAGIMKGTQSRKERAMLDGVLIRVGDSYKNVQVVEINDQAVALQYKEEVIWLYSGQRTTE